MNKLVIDIKDGYAIVATGGDFEPEFIKIDFDEADFTAESGEDNSSSTGLFDLSEDRVADIYHRADQIVLAIPMRFSLVKSVAIDQAALKNYGDDFLQWEARQQIPEELGQFITGFKKMSECQNSKYGKYLFYAAPEDFIEVLLNFVAPDTKQKLILDSEAVGLFKALDLAAENGSFCAAISLEHDGAAVVLSRNNEFLGGRFISGESPNLGDEIMFYIMGQALEDKKPQVLICGDIDHLSNLGSISWAERLKIPESLNLINKPGLGNPDVFVTAAGLIMNM